MLFQQESLASTDAFRLQTMSECKFIQQVILHTSDLLLAVHWLLSKAAHPRSVADVETDLCRSCWHILRRTWAWVYQRLQQGKELT